jgi:hypothetical protein
MTNGGESNIMLDGKIRYLGCYKTEDEANNAYVVAEKCILEGKEIPSRPNRIVKTSKYVGVCLNKETNKWVAQIRVNKKQRKLGSFETEFAAHQEYERVLKELSNA